MIKAKAENNNGEIRLTIKGHANAAPKGADLICAAATVSAYQLAQVAREMFERGALNGKPTVQIREGKAKVRLTPMPDAADEAMHTMYVVCTGLRLLAANYPDNITFDDTGLTA